MSKKYFIFEKKSELTESVCAKLIEALNKAGFIFDAKAPDFVISVGGDGTFLKAVKEYCDFKPVFAAINCGNLGFLSEYKSSEVDVLISDLINENLTLKEIKVLEAKFNKKVHYAFNEFRIQSANHETIDLAITINGQYLETLRGNGCCISSTYGSSGLNRSLGGAIINHDLDLIELTEMAPVQNTYFRTISAPLILGSDATIGLTNTNHRKIVICYDSASEILEDNGEELLFSYSAKSVKMLKNKNNNYVKKLREAFINDKSN